MLRRHVRGGRGLRRGQLSSLLGGLRGTRGLLQQRPLHQRRLPLSVEGPRGGCIRRAPGTPRPDLTRMLRDPTRRHYLAMLGADPIGMPWLDVYEEYTDITVVGVLPEHQGCGYGRQMLLDAVEMLLAEGQEGIVSDVSRTTGERWGSTSRAASR
jgi:ribosomal protein S18 acetylase RimI-like enzyme